MSSSGRSIFGRIRCCARNLTANIATIPTANSTAPGQTSQGSGARALIAETAGRLQSRIRAGIHQMQAEGLIGAHVDADAIAHSLVAGIHGATLLQLATGADSHIGNVIDTAVEQLESSAPQRTAVQPT
ncbi:hypothetical protein [Nocardia sp. NPDC004123]